MTIWNEADAHAARDETYPHSVAFDPERLAAFGRLAGVWTTEMRRVNEVARETGVSFARMAEAWIALNADDRPYDLRPDACWRCDARAATSDLGTCDDCLTVLRADG